MARVSFEVTRRFDADPRIVWDKLIDWPSHGEWVPLTKMEVAEPGSDPTEPGYEFTGWTGVRPLALQDRMRVTRCDWDESARTGFCTVDKIGPTLGGDAGFTVRPDGTGTELVWQEDVVVPYVPGFLSGVAAWFGRVGFRSALKRFDRYLTTTPA